MSRAIPAFTALLVSITLLLTACEPQPAPVAETAPPPEPATTQETPASPPATEPAPAQEPEPPAQETAPPATAPQPAPEPPPPAPPPPDTPAPDTTTTLMPRGTPDPDLEVTVYQPDKAWAGTTLLPDNHNAAAAPRIIEVNMLGEIIWEYRIPASLKQYTNPGFDVEPLENGHILYVLPGKGVYEIERSGNVVWSYLTQKISHDADRLPNGNTIFSFGNEDGKSDAQVTEVNPDGNIVWQWHAADHFDEAPYKDIEKQGWTHTNGVSRLSNGNTLISPRNFNFVVEVAPGGELVGTYGEGIFRSQHDPEFLPNGNIILANQARPHQAIEFEPDTGRIIWKSLAFELSDTPVRDANRLPNGNTLITASRRIVEVTPEGEIVWQLDLNADFPQEAAAGMGFYKAERIAPDE